jgi:hypothetical protein
MNSADNCEWRASFQTPPTPDVADGRKMNSWYAKLPDWQMGVTWLVVTAVAGVIYFVPVVRLLAPFADWAGLFAQ